MKISKNDIFRNDGTIKGTTFRQTQPQRGSTYPMLAVKLPSTLNETFEKSYPINNNFYEKYEEMTLDIAKMLRIPLKSSLYNDMLDSSSFYLKRYNMKVEVEVRPIEFQTLVYNKKERV